MKNFLGFVFFLYVASHIFTLSNPSPHSEKLQQMANEISRKADQDAKDTFAKLYETKAERKARLEAEKRQRRIDRNNLKSAVTKDVKTMVQWSPKKLASRIQRECLAFEKFERMGMQLGHPDCSCTLDHLKYFRKEEIVYLYATGKINANSMSGTRKTHPEVVRSTLDFTHSRTRQLKDRWWKIERSCEKA